MRTNWTIEMIRILTEEYPISKSSILAQRLGVTLTSIYAKAKALNLKKSESFLESDQSGRLKKGSLIGTKFQFKKGHKPSTAGKRQSEFMDPEALERAKLGWFKPGQKVHNEGEDGEIRVRKDRNGKSYKFIRISKGKWIHLHVHLWETYHNQSARGKVLHFKDGNTMNCVIENIEAISREHLMLKNTIHNYPIEVKKTIRALSKLKKTIHEKQDQRP